LQGDEQAWEIFINSESDAVITWANRVFSDVEGLRLAMLPTLGESSYTTATGWLWCLAAGNPVDKEQAIRLAEFLVAPDFFEEWSPSSGFFPVRPSSLNGWSESTLKRTAVRMLQSAQPRPVRLLTSIITPELKNSVAEILLRQSTPAESAQKLFERLEVIETQ
jgi:ABC-type glycerol-3-phosphate transport system substrate-binding protein